MEKLDKITDVKVADQQTETDPRSKTTADKAFNPITLADLRCQLVVKKNVSRKEKKISKRINLCGYRR